MMRGFACRGICTGPCTRQHGTGPQARLDVCARSPRRPGPPHAHARTHAPWRAGTGTPPSACRRCGGPHTPACDCFGRSSQGRLTAALGDATRKSATQPTPWFRVYAFYPEVHDYNIADKCPPRLKLVFTWKTCASASDCRCSAMSDLVMVALNNSVWRAAGSAFRMRLHPGGQEGVAKGAGVSPQGGKARVSSSASLRCPMVTTWSPFPPPWSRVVWNGR